jgi:hypothetical protein
MFVLIEASIWINYFFFDLIGESRIEISRYHIGILLNPSDIMRSLLGGEVLGNYFRLFARHIFTRLLVLTLVDPHYFQRPK